YSGVTKTVTLTVNPPTLATLSLNPTTVIGGSTSTGTVTLSGAAPTGGATVTLLSSNTAAATAPASVLVAAGANTATFTITSKAVAASPPRPSSDPYSGVTKAATLTVNPPTLSTLTRSPTTVIGGGTSTGTVTLTGPAPTGGATVTL